MTQSFQNGAISRQQGQLGSITCCTIWLEPCLNKWAGECSRYSNRLWPGWSGDRIPVGTRFSAPVQTSPGAHPASCTKGTGFFLGVKSGRGLTLTLHPLLVPWSWKSRVIPLLPLWAIWPVQSLSACTTVHFTFYAWTISCSVRFFEISGLCQCTSVLLRVYGVCEKARTNYLLTGHCTLWSNLHRVYGSSTHCMGILLRP